MAPTAPAARAGAPGAPGDPRWGDGVVATVAEVSDHAATYGNPPRVKLEVHEVFQGDPDVDRTNAVWEPPPHDVDTGTIYDDPRYKAWAATKMEGPEVGSRWILYGRLSAAEPGEEPVLYISSEAAVPFTEEDLAREKEDVRQRAERGRKAAEEREAERRAEARFKELWQRMTVQQNLASHVLEADLIVTARWTSAASHTNAICVQVTGVLKGELRTARGRGADGKEAPHYIDFDAGPSLQVLMDRDTEYLLFLSERGMELGVTSPLYPRVRSGDGVVVAEGAALEAVKHAVGRLPDPPGRPLVVVEVNGDSFDPVDDFRAQFGRAARLIEDAADDRFTVLRSRRFMPETDPKWAAERTRELVPDLDYFILAHFDNPGQAGQPPTRLSVAAVSVRRDEAQVLSEEQWSLEDGGQARDKALALMHTLADNGRASERGEGTGR